MIDLLPGFVQGLTRVTISYPFDTIKVYMQKNLYKNTFDTIVNIIKTDLKIFYRGSLIPYIFVPVDRSLQFYFTEKYKQQINPLIMSSLLAILTTLYNLPVQYLTANIVLEKKENWISIKHFMKNIKFNNLYKGLYIELPKTVIASGSYIGSYYYLRTKYNKENNLIKTPIIAIISSIICWSIIFPIDTIRNDLQTTKNLTSQTLILNRFNNYGLLNFYKGITPVFIRTIPSSALGMLAYETTRKFTKRL